MDFIYEHLIGKKNPKRMSMCLCVWYFNIELSRTRRFIYLFFLSALVLVDDI